MPKPWPYSAIDCTNNEPKVSLLHIILLHRC